MAKKPMLLSDLFHETLKDIYFAENKIIKTLPKMAKAAQSKDLQKAFMQASSGNRRPSKAAQSGLLRLSASQHAERTCAAINGISKPSSRSSLPFTFQSMRTSRILRSTTPSRPTIAVSINSPEDKATTREITHVVGK